jgi:hypothetical protein
MKLPLSKNRLVASLDQRAVGLLIVYVERKK